MTRVWLLIPMLIAALAVVPAGAEDVPPPADGVMLRVTGDIEHTNAGERAEFDREALAALGLHRIRTTTAWTDGVVEFEGPLLCDLLDLVGARGTTLFARALNDYTVEIPIADCRRYPVLLALRWNGRELRVRDKGPIWIVYPRDDYPELRSEVINSRWVWQLVRLDVR